MLLPLSPKAASSSSCVAPFAPDAYHFYMGQAQMISYGAMLGKIKKAILGNDDGDTKKLLELLLDTWIDEVEDQLK